ncbi:MAG TPA: helicase-related protein, partial [Candidatus Paceibacterota bacterium]|nr:helicase-related protein [Candidatus Paceibacterota bacterium]
LLTRKDVIIVASVSCIYGLGSPEEYQKVNLRLEVDMTLDRLSLIKRLVDIHYERTNADINPGTFRSIGQKVEIMPSSETFVYQIEFSGKNISKILKIIPVSGQIVGEPENIFLFPTKHFITDKKIVEKAIGQIKKELTGQLKKFEKEGKLLEVERLKRRTTYDLAMIKEIGYCNGIENYSRHFSGKKEGEPPETLLSYFREDFLTVIDESHVTLPQLQGMYAGDASRKETLVSYGFRLPSAKDNRPLKYNEFEERVGQVIYVSATPAEKERRESGQIVEQIIRPTGLIDPEVIVRPVSASSNYSEEKLFVRSSDEGGRGARPSQKVSLPLHKYGGQIEDFMEEAEKVIKKGNRVIATTLTKKMAEDLSIYLKEKGLKAEYLHSEIKTIERIEIITSFRKGEIDILVGVNLLREGLDLPELALIGILDADKAGFLRSETSLIQTIGRAARNIDGRVILYADHLNDALEKAINETNRRRQIQIAHNKKYNITPKTITKNIKDITEGLEDKHKKSVNLELELDLEVFEKAFKKDKSNKGKGERDSIKNLLLSDEARKQKVLDKIIKIKEEQMNQAVKRLDFETAAILRDEIVVLRQKLK